VQFAIHSKACGRVAQYIQGEVGFYTDTENLDDSSGRYQQSSSQSFGAVQKVLVVGKHVVLVLYQIAAFVLVDYLESSLGCNRLRWGFRVRQKLTADPNPGGKT
jgi:hypothetical protein